MGYQWCIFQMIELLQDYMKRPLSDFERGVSDCCAWAAGWAQLLSGKPTATDLLCPMTDHQAMRILNRHGGLLGLVGHVLESDGWEPVEKPQDGDIVVIEDATALLSHTVGVWHLNRCVSVSESATLFISKKPKVKGAWRWA